jgi:hypothetical protein
MRWALLVETGGLDGVANRDTPDDSQDEDISWLTNG